MEAVQAIPSSPQDQALESAVQAVAEVKAEVPAGDDFYAELAQLREFADQRGFADVSELLASEQLEQEGVWRPIPLFRGAEIRICHQTTAAEKREQLEAKFRERYSIPLNTPLTARQREAIWREAYFGTVIRDWRGVLLNGKPLEFTAENCRLLMKSRRFRLFVLQESNSFETFRSEREQALRGNS